MSELVVNVLVVAFRRVAVVVVVVDSIAVEFVSTRWGAWPCDNNHSHGGKFSLLEKEGAVSC